MKILKLTLPILLMSSLITASCKKNDDTNPSSNNSSGSTLSGNWRVTLYNDSGTDELYHFNGYTFTFSNGTVTASKNGNTITGNYSTGIDDGKKKLYLNFGNVVPFEELNDDWNIIEEASTKMRLQDISGGNNETDLLTFEKN